MKPRTMRAVDLFCGGGGTSTGLALAMKALGHNVDLVAVNHWQVAVETHTRNHPWARHVCERVEAVDKFGLFPGHASVDGIAASPECVEFSVAKGGRPVNDQRRTGAWYVLDWVSQLKPKWVVVENVPEFKKWGKIDKAGKRLRHSEGTIYKAWKEAFRGLGYNLVDPVLNAADYGAYTTRRRLYVLAKRGKQPIHVPAVTHADPKKGPIPEGLKPWRAAREILDFSLPSESIYGTRSNGRALSQRTLDRIAKGLRTSPHGGALEPLARAVETRAGPIPLRSLIGPAGVPIVEEMLVELYGTGSTRSTDKPLGTVTASGEHFALADARFTLGQHGGAELRADTEPVATIATGGALRLVEALIFGTRGRRYHREQDANRPLPTLTTHAEFALAEALVLPPRGIHGGPDANPAYAAGARPLHTLTQRDAHVIEPVVVNLHRPETNRSVGRGPDEPLPTLTGSPQIGVVDAAMLLPPFGEREGQALRAHGVDAPVPTITAQRGGPDLAFLLSYYRNGGLRSADEPLGTQTTHDRHGLVTADVVRAQAEALLDSLYVDVRLRMLHPKELAAAMGFPPTYEFVGTRTEVVKQIGNAVEVNVARAIFTSLMTGAKQPVLDVFDQGGSAEVEA